MAANGQNAQQLAAAAALHSQMEAISSAPNIFRIAPSADNSNISFPVQLGSTDPADEKFALRRQILGKETVVPGIGQAIVGDDFWDYTKRRLDQDSLFQFKTWVLQQMDLKTPAEAAAWKAIVPWAIDDKIAYIDQVGQYQSRAAKIAINGPQNQDDLLFLWLMKRGDIVIPEQALHLLGTTTQGIADDYQAGFFSPFSKTKNLPMSPLDKASAGVTWNNPLMTTKWGTAANAFAFTGLPSAGNLNPLWQANKP